MSALDPSKPELDFVTRTRDHVIKYQGATEFTNLLNCLLGLIIVPRERQSMLKMIPEEPLANVPWDGAGMPTVDWGICRCCKEPMRQSTKTLVVKLRKAAAHCKLSFTTDDTQTPATWKEIIFKADKDFIATFTFAQLKTFALYICDKLSKPSHP